MTKRPARGRHRFGRPLRGGTPNPRAAVDNGADATEAVALGPSDDPLDWEHQVNALPQEPPHRQDDNTEWLRRLSGRDLAQYRPPLNGEPPSLTDAPLHWGGSGARWLGLRGNVTPLAFEAIFNRQGMLDPRSWERLVLTSRPGLLLRAEAHVSVAVLGVIGRYDHMHQILDAQRDGTLDWLDKAIRDHGGFRPDTAEVTKTNGPIYATCRRLVSPADNPFAADDIILANAVGMRHHAGGYARLHGPGVPPIDDIAEAAVMVGRLAASAQAVKLGYAIEPHSQDRKTWRIIGIPDEVCDRFTDPPTLAVDRRPSGPAIGIG